MSIRTSAVAQLVLIYPRSASLASQQQEDGWIRVTIQRSALSSGTLLVRQMSTRRMEMLTFLMVLSDIVLPEPDTTLFMIHDHVK